MFRVNNLRLVRDKKRAKVLRKQYLKLLLWIC